jgi:hypothetical protein
VDSRLGNQVSGFRAYYLPYLTRKRAVHFRVITLTTTQQLQTGKQCARLRSGVGFRRRMKVEG